jgi:trehalose 2-sulfotransferase
MQDAKSVLLNLISEAASATDRWNPFQRVALTEEESVSLPPQNQHWKPLYVICMTARSGSTMLTSILERTRVLGRPDEYINPRGPFQSHYETTGQCDLRTYFHRLWKWYSGPGGIFGIKTPYQDLWPFVRCHLFHEWLRGANCVYLTRENVYEQAVSLVIARQSQVWHRIDGGPTLRTNGSPQFDLPSLRIALSRIVRERALWESLFALHGITPLRLTYEELVQDGRGSPKNVRRVIRFLGYDIPEDYPVPGPATCKLGGEVNEEWAIRLREEIDDDPLIRELLECRD